MKIYHKYYLPNTYNYKTLYLIHGLGEYSGRYVNFIKQLNDKGVAVFTFDLPGHGYTPGKKGDIENFYEIYSFLENYVQEEYILFGHSLGGLIASRFVEITEKKPQKLILSSPALGDIRQLSWLLTLFSIFPSLSFSNGINPYDLSTDKKACELYKKDPLVHDKITVRTARQMFDEAEIALKEIEKVDIPTLLLFGEEDKIVNIEEYKKIKNSNITKVSFSKGKHELFECIYNKKEFYNKILEFLE